MLNKNTIPTGSIPPVNPQSNQPVVKTPVQKLNKNNTPNSKTTKLTPQQINKENESMRKSVLAAKDFLYEKQLKQSLNEAISERDIDLVLSLAEKDGLTQRYAEDVYSIRLDKIFNQPISQKDTEEFKFLVECSFYTSGGNIDSNFLEKVIKNNDPVLLKSFLEVKTNGYEGRRSIAQQSLRAAYFSDKLDLLDSLFKVGLVPEIDLIKDLIRFEQLINPQFEKLLKKLPDINAKYSDYKGQRASGILDAALERGDSNLLKFLLKKGAKPDFETILNAPMYSKYKNLNTFNLLLEKVTDINFKNEEGHTIAHELIKEIIHPERNDKLDNEKNMQIAMLKQLVKKGAALNGSVVGAYGRETTYLNAAIKIERTLFKYLVSAGADVNMKDSYGDFPLSLAVQEGDLELTKFLLNKTNPINTREAFFVAIEKGNLKVLDLFLKKGIKLNAKSDQDILPIHYAASHGYLDIVKYFIKNGANIGAKNRDGDKAYLVAARNGKIKTALYLIENDKQLDLKTPDPARDAALFKAAVGQGDLKILESLIIKGADLNSKNKNGETAMHHLMNGFEKMNSNIFWIQFSRNRKPEVNDVIKDLDTLHSMFLYLAEKNNDINAQDIKGRTVLKCLVDSLSIFRSYGKPIREKVDEEIRFMAEVLIKNGADLNLKDKAGETVLQSAIQYGNVDLIKILVENGADINSKNLKGESVLERFFTSRFDREVFDYLLSKKIDVNVKLITYKDHSSLLHLVLEGMNPSQLSKVSDGPQKRKGTRDLAFQIFIRLVENGADINMKNVDGTTVLEKANQFGDAEAVEYIKQKGAS